MKNSKVIKAVLSQVILFVVNTVTALFYTPYLLNRLGGEVYAFYPLSLGIVNFGSVITVISTSMLSAFLINDFKAGNFRKVNEFINSSLFSNLLTASLITLPLFVASVFIDKILTVPAELVFQIKLLFVTVTAAFFITQIKNTFMVTYLASGNRYLNSSHKALEKSIAIMFTVIVFFIIKPSVLWVGGGVLAGAVIRFFITLRSSKKIFPALALGKGYVRKSVVKELFGAGSWNAVTQLIFILSVNISAPLANIIFGPEIQSFYSLGTQIPTQLGYLFVYLINSFMLFFAVLFKNRDYDNLKRDILSMLKVMSVILGAVSALFTGLGDCFLKIWIPGYYSESIYIIMVIFFASFMITGSFYVIYSMLVIYNKVKIPAVFMVATGILNIPLSLIIIKLTGGSIYSIAVASLITGAVQYVVFIPLYFTQKTKMKKEKLYASFLKGLYTYGAGVGISFIIKILFYPDSFLKLLAVALSVIILTGLFSFVHLIKRADIAMIKRIIKANIEYRNDLSELQGSDYDSLL